MKHLTILLLAILVISCSTKKNIQHTSTEVKVSAESEKLQHSVVDSASLVKASLITTKEEDSGYTKEIVEEITEYVPGTNGKQSYVDPADSLMVFPDAGRIRITKRTTREKGQKTTTTITQSNNSDSTHLKADHLVQEKSKVDSSAIHAELKKEVKRNGLTWYWWLFVIVAVLVLIYRYRYKILGVWNWALYRLIGRKPPNNADNRRST